MTDAAKDKSPDAGCFIVGTGVTIQGEFVVPERAVINGSVEGEISARELLVGAGGKITGKVRAEVIDVHGEIHDSVSASKALILRSSGRATGTIEYAELEIEKGAQLRGTLSIIGLDAEGKRSEPGEPAR